MIRVFLTMEEADEGTQEGVRRHRLYREDDARRGGKLQASQVPAVDDLRLWWSVRGAVAEKAAAKHLRMEWTGKGEAGRHRKDVGDLYEVRSSGGELVIRIKPKEVEKKDPFTMWILGVVREDCRIVDLVGWNWTEDIVVLGRLNTDIPVPAYEHSYLRDMKDLPRAGAKP